jgi:3'(2'), 5'-bisphosphate nucleotidase
MPFETLDAEATFALRAVIHAARLCRRLEIEGAPAASKADRSPVTAADFAAQAVVGGLLQEAFPADGVVAEEDSRVLLDDVSSDRLNAVVEAVRLVMPEATAGQVRRWIDREGSPAGRFWALDPLDGTKGFLRDGQYAVALALLEEGQVVLGAIACPKLGLAARGSRESEGTVALAVRGAGAFAAPMGSSSSPACVSRPSMTPVGPGSCGRSKPTTPMSPNWMRSPASWASTRPRSGWTARPSRSFSPPGRGS